MKSKKSFINKMYFEFYLGLCIEIWVSSIAPNASGIPNLTSNWGTFCFHFVYSFRKLKKILRTVPN